MTYTKVLFLWFIFALLIRYENNFLSYSLSINTRFLSNLFTYISFIYNVIMKRNAVFHPLKNSRLQHLDIQTKTIFQYPCKIQNRMVTHRTFSKTFRSKNFCTIQCMQICFFVMASKKIMLNIDCDSFLWEIHLWLISVASKCHSNQITEI